MIAADERAEWAAALAGFRIRLDRDGAPPPIGASPATCSAAGRWRRSVISSRCSTGGPASERLGGGRDRLDGNPHPRPADRAGRALEHGALRHRPRRPRRLVPLTPSLSRPRAARRPTPPAIGTPEPRITLAIGQNRVRSALIVLQLLGGGVGRNADLEADVRERLLDLLLEGRAAAVEPGVRLHLEAADGDAVAGRDALRDHVRAGDQRGPSASRWGMGPGWCRRGRAARPRSSRRRGSSPACAHGSRQCRSGPARCGFWVSRSPWWGILRRLVARGLERRPDARGVW